MFSIQHSMQDWSASRKHETTTALITLLHDKKIVTRQSGTWVITFGSLRGIKRTSPFRVVTALLEELSGTDRGCLLCDTHGRTMEHFKKSVHVTKPLKAPVCAAARDFVLEHFPPYEEE